LKLKTLIRNNFYMGKVKTKPEEPTVDEMLDHMFDKFGGGTDEERKGFKQTIEFMAHTPPKKKSKNQGK